MSCYARWPCFGFELWLQQCRVRSMAEMFEHVDGMYVKQSIEIWITASVALYQAPHAVQCRGMFHNLDTPCIPVPIHADRNFQDCLLFFFLHVPCCQRRGKRYMTTSYGTPCKPPPNTDCLTHNLLEPLGATSCLVALRKFLTSCRMARSSMTSSLPPGILVPGTSR